MSGSVSAIGNYAWETGCSVVCEAKEAGQIFIDKAPKSIEFVYAHFKMIGDAFKPLLETVGYSMGNDSEGGVCHGLRFLFSNFQHAGTLSSSLPMLQEIVQFMLRRERRHVSSLD